jgi:hypothetical protein
MPPPTIRIARATARLAEIARMYEAGLGLEVLDSFRGHDGFDGVILGSPGAQYHLEFTERAGGSDVRAPGEDDLLVLYLPDDEAWVAACSRMAAAGFRAVQPSNPWWARRGCTFEDLERRRVVLQNAGWPE